MSDAKKCDRCGTFYEEPFKRREYKLHWNKNFDSTTPSTDFTPVDLCTDCHGKLMEWYNNE